MPNVKKLASQSSQRYNTPNLNMEKSPSDQATAVLPHLVKKGSLTTCKTTDSVGVHGNSGNKSVKKQLLWIGKDYKQRQKIRKTSLETLDGRNN